MGPEKYLERVEGEQSESWTTVSLTSSLHTSHSTPAQNKKGKTQLDNERLGLGRSQIVLGFIFKIFMP